MVNLTAPADEIAAILDRVRRDLPLVHIISNIGSFCIALFDALGDLDATDIFDRAKIREIDTRSSNGDS